MTDPKFKLYGYRWVVLAVFMFINITIQMLWIVYAPITGPAAQFYGVTDLQIGFLAMSFMIAFIPLSIPVSWVIDTYGFRIAVGIGAILMGVFGLLRGFAGSNYTLVLWSTIGIAVAQPFLLNAWTTVPAKWFAVQERATAVGAVTLGNLLGTGIGMALTPELIKIMPISTVQLVYGAIAAFSAVLFVILAREKPPTPPCEPGMEGFLDVFVHFICWSGTFQWRHHLGGRYHSSERFHTHRRWYARRAHARRRAAGRGYYSINFR
jgi:MFS family permease